MTNFSFQASSLRALVKLMLPSAESKNMSESNYCTLSVQMRETVGEDGALVRQHVLLAETSQPTFSLAAQLPLTTDGVETDGVAVRVATRDLDRALASFGQKVCQVALSGDGGLRLTTLCQCGSDGCPTGHPVKEVLVKGQAVALQELPEVIGADCVLPDMLPLLDGLRAAVDIAATRGNGLKMQGVRVEWSPACLYVEGANPGVKAVTSYDDPWQVVPAEGRSCVVTTDAVRHVIAALSAYGIGSQLRMCLRDRVLTVQTELVTAMCDVN